MKTVSTKNLSNLSVKDKSINIYEVIISLYVFLGVFMADDELNTLRYMISIILQIILLFYLIKGVKISKEIWYKYILVLGCIFIIAMNFLLLNVKINLIVNRIGALISVFGIILACDRAFKFNYKNIVTYFLFIYTVLAFVVNLDAFVFLIFKNTLFWEPMYYLGYRFAGPFQDPNFMALYSACAIIMVCNIKPIKTRYRVICFAVLIINIILTGALSTFIFVPLVFLIHKIFKPKKLIKKQLIILAIYFFLLFLFATFESKIESILLRFLQSYYGNIVDAQTKLGSFTIRIKTQIKAMGIVMKSFFGQGPLQIVPQLNYDTHNSYIGIMFEQGIAGLFLIFFTLKIRKCNNSISNYMSTYLMLSALLLNVHYSSIYSLLLIIQYWNETPINNKKDMPSKKRYI